MQNILFGNCALKDTVIYIGIIYGVVKVSHTIEFKDGITEGC